MYIIRIQFNKDSELEILSNYNNLIKYELEVVRTEVQVIHNIYPNSLKPIPEFDNATQLNTWTKSIHKLIIYFRNTIKNFQNTLVTIYYYNII